MSVSTAYKFHRFCFTIKDIMKKIVLALISILLFVLAQNTTLAQDEDLLNAYINRLQTRVKLNWVLPPKHRDKSTVIRFTINKEGQVTNADVTTSSLDDKFDKSALLAIYQAIPYEQLPKNTEDLVVDYFFSPTVVRATEVNNFNQKAHDNFNVVSNSDKENIKNVNFYPYMKSLEKKIKSNWEPPKVKENRSVVTLFKINKDGTINGAKILKTSGDGICDNAALMAIYKSSPVGALPKNFEGNSIDIQFNFDYKVLDNNESPNVNINFNHSNDYQYYKQRVYTILSYNLPKKRYFKDKYLMLNITIDKNGKLKSIEKQTSSGDINFDNIVIASLKKCSFPAIPDSLNTNEFVLDYTVKVQHFAQENMSNALLFTSLLNLTSSILLLNLLH